MRRIQAYVAFLSLELSAPSNKVAKTTAATDIRQPFNPVTRSPSSCGPSQRLGATHPLEEQQGFAFLPCADPVLANYLQSTHQSCRNPHIWCDLAA